MQFHDYTTLRKKMIQGSQTADFRSWAKTASADDFRRLFAASARKSYDESADSDERDLAATHLGAAMAEARWVELQRPFYNVWPIAVELAQSVKLNISFSAVSLPFDVLLLRFPRGRELSGVATCLLTWFPTHVQVHGYFLPETENQRVTLDWTFKPEDNVERWLEFTEAETSTDLRAIGAGVIRLIVFVGLLSNERDLITPVVLSKDRAKYESADDPDVKRWLEDRAARKMGRGFDVGKTFELERETSPHWRNPHLALFWMGPGRITPIIKMRRGAVVQRVSMADVPTGYFGPETDAEEELTDEKTPRDAISKSRRFIIMQRDSFTCQLCGASSETGAKLHVDHMIPLAKGGSNDDDNLWTLCEACNLGKSDKLL